MKKFFTWVLHGIAGALGGLIFHWIVKMFRDPSERAKVKRRFNKIKDAFKD